MTGVDVWADTRAQLTAAWDVRGIDVATLAVTTGDARATRRQATPGATAPRTLPPLLEERGGVPPSFSLGRTLGEGGMGVVKAATQTALEREVAIKCLHEDADPRAAAQLLREARIVGALEHPNIVPVHALGADARGRPVLVMKRVEGVGWDESLAREERSADPERFLRRHLDILQRVARAAHFAHERGIVHRDIKPANVMLGAEGEVYLVDWGVAVSHRAGAIRDVPAARDVNAIEGTPAYMSPEMASADGASIGPRTDVYLLGATLFEVLTGKPPHEGDSLLEVLTRAFGSEPRHYDDWVPRALRVICDRAMAREAADRFATAHDFADAIGVVLEHRASVILTEEAGSRLAELETASSHPSARDTAALHEIHTLFAECRFAFSHALATWPDNEAARRGLTRTIELMVGVELAREAPEAAALLLRDLPGPAPELEQTVEEALKRRLRRGARLERLVRDADVRVGARQRGGLAIVLGAWWTVSFVGLGQLERYGLLEPRHVHVLVAVGVSFALAAAGAFVLRDALNSRLSRAQLLSIALLQGAHVIAVTAAWAAGLPLPTTSMLMALMGGVAFATGAALVDRAYVSMVLAILLGLGCMIAWPAVHFEVLGAGGGLGALLSARNLFRAVTADEHPASSPL